MKRVDINVEINLFWLAVFLLVIMILTSCRSAPFDYLLEGRDAKFDVAMAMSPPDVPGRHPYFNDKGALKWYRDATVGEALKSSDHLIVEVGRLKCGLCKKFVEQVLPRLTKKELKGFVGVESNADNMNVTIKHYVYTKMKHATLLPVVMVFKKHPNGAIEYIGGLYGNIAKQVKSFKALLKKAKK